MHGIIRNKYNEWLTIIVKNLRRKLDFLRLFASLGREAILIPNSIRLSSCYEI